MRWTIIGAYALGLAAIAGGAAVTAFVPGGQVAGAALITAGSGWLMKISKQPEFMK